MYPQTGGLLNSGVENVTRPYTKSATSWAEQVSLLQQRGMVIANPTEAEQIANGINQRLFIWTAPGLARDISCFGEAVNQIV